jgi:hypothetical protein
MSFAQDIQKFAQHCIDNADLVVRKTVLDIGRSLVEKTPVGNPELWQNPDNKPDGYVGGHARANWSHSIGALVNQEFKEIDATGGASIDRIVGSVPVKAAGKVHYIQNSLPYMQALEDGHSTQAPAGIVAVTEVEFHDYVEKAIGELT